jgi:DNA primase
MNERRSADVRRTAATLGARHKVLSVADAIDLTVNGPKGPRPVRVSHPDKVYFPELSITKLDVVRYFLSVGDGIIEALRERPTTLERWPGGVVPGVKLTVWKGERGEAFFQKRLPKGAPEWVETARGVPR